MVAFLPIPYLYRIECVRLILMNGCRILAVTVLLMLIFSMTAAAEITNVTIGTDENVVTEELG